MSLSRQFQGGLFQACRHLGISRSSWYLRRHITELFSIDPALFNEELKLAIARKLHVRAFNEICKKHLETPYLKMKYHKLQSSGALL